jgi:hypothetical protein
MGRGAWKEMSPPSHEGHGRRNIRLGIINRAFAEVGKTLAAACVRQDVPNPGRQRLGRRRRDQRQPGTLIPVRVLHLPR